MKYILSLIVMSLLFSCSLFSQKHLIKYDLDKSVKQKTSLSQDCRVKYKSNLRQSEKKNLKFVGKAIIDSRYFSGIHTSGEEIQSIMDNTRPFLCERGILHAVFSFKKSHLKELLLYSHN